MPAVLSYGLIGRLFGGSRPPESDAFHDLRYRALTVTASELGLEPGPAAPIHGVIMETGYPEAAATFVCLRDGAVSLYFSTGGGVIGGGQDGSVRAACLDLLIAHCQAVLSDVRKAEEGR